MLLLFSVLASANPHLDAQNLTVRYQWESLPTVKVCPDSSWTLQDAPNLTISTLISAFLPPQSLPEFSLIWACSTASPCTLDTALSFPLYRFQIYQRLPAL